jgi:quinol monooxygenase YgiN
MSVVVLLEPQIASGKAEAMIALLRQALPETRAYDGCEGVVMHRDQDDLDRVLLIERWASRQQYESYLQWRADRGDAERLGALSSGPPLIRYLDAIEG